MQADKHKIIQEVLKEIFDNVNNWLTHAEAKNAALIAFNVACLSIIFNLKDISEIQILFYIIVIGMLLSTIMALTSFFPKIGKEKKNTNVISSHDNLIFYADIAKYHKDEYIKAIFKQYGDVDIEDTEIQKIEKDFSEEITYNATIVMRKYKLFKFALGTEISILVFIIVALIVA